MLFWAVAKTGLKCALGGRLVRRGDLSQKAAPHPWHPPCPERLWPGGHIGQIPKGRSSEEDLTLLLCKQQLSYLWRQTRPTASSPPPTTLPVSEMMAGPEARAPGPPSPC